MYFLHSGFVTTFAWPANRLSPDIFHCIEYSFYYSWFLSNGACPEKKTELPSNFSLYWIYFLHSGFLSNLHLRWNTEGALNTQYWIYIFYYSGFLSNLRLPWKTELPWKFSLYLNIFYHSGFLGNLRLPWKQSLPWGAAAIPDPPPRTPMTTAHTNTEFSDLWKHCYGFTHAHSTKIRG